MARLTAHAQLTALGSNQACVPSAMSVSTVCSQQIAHLVGHNTGYIRSLAVNGTYLDQSKVYIEVTETVGMSMSGVCQ